MEIDPEGGRRIKSLPRSSAATAFGVDGDPDYQPGGVATLNPRLLRL